MTYGFPIDPKLDLVLERVVDVPPELVWRAWTEPEHVVKWFTPAPWTTIACKIDLRPGGLFHTVMRSPEGEEFPGDGCFLEVEKNRKLVWTACLLPGYRPKGAQPGELPFTATILLEPEGAGTRYTAIAVHGSETDGKRHTEMGFHDGWGKALDQLVAHAKANM
ncbi:MAG TPA: SRPBCC family protein [Rhizomicrobium sp.]|nr:SRPBCC family protein [Rhizomicrobium sp.]